MMHTVVVEYRDFDGETKPCIAIYGQSRWLAFAQWLWELVCPVCHNWSAFGGQKWWDNHVSVTDRLERLMKFLYATPVDDFHGAADAIWGSCE